MIPRHCYSINIIYHFKCNVRNEKKKTFIRKASGGSVKGFNVRITQFISGYYISLND